MDKQTSLILDQMNIIALQQSKNISEETKKVLEKEATRLAAENMKVICDNMRNAPFIIQTAVA